MFALRDAAVPLPAASGVVSLRLNLMARGSFAHARMRAFFLFWGSDVPLHIGRCGRLFFPTRGKEPKGARWQPIRDSTMAAPGPLAAWLGGGTF